jgi:hypothetical protein
VQPRTQQEMSFEKRACVVKDLENVSIRHAFTTHLAFDLLACSTSLRLAS